VLIVYNCILSFYFGGGLIESVQTEGHILIVLLCIIFLTIYVLNTKKNMFSFFRIIFIHLEFWRGSRKRESAGFE